MPEDKINIGTALRLMSGDRPMATCPYDDEHAGRRRL